MASDSRARQLQSSWIAHVIMGVSLKLRKGPLEALKPVHQSVIGLLKFSITGPNNPALVWADCPRRQSWSAITLVGTSSMTLQKRCNHQRLQGCDSRMLNANEHTKTPQHNPRLFSLQSCRNPLTLFCHLVCFFPSTWHAGVNLQGPCIMQGGRSVGCTIQRI